MSTPQHIALTAALLALVTACGSSGSLRRLGSGASTAHERYAERLRTAGLDSTALGREWLTAADSALRSPYAATLPARELGIYTRNEARAVAYRITLRDGERLRITLRADGPRARLYLDLFEVTGDSLPRFEHRVTASDSIPADSAAALLTLQYEATRNATVAVRLQPELLRSGRYDLSMRVEPILAFPVEGRGNAAIQSLFGVERDGGQRAHHGIDIFAPRGTPVLAATDGVVRSTSPNTLGGKVVWLSDGERRQSLYYAHLDSQTVSAGQRVRTGDTLGFVGNTGNARTTAPHLHFGIYTRDGPIDPLRYVRLVTERPPALTADSTALGRRATGRSDALELRIGPGRSDTRARRVAPGTPFVIMGASGETYRVQFDDGQSGYISARAARVTPAR